VLLVWNYRVILDYWNRLGLLHERGHERNDFLHFHIYFYSDMYNKGDVQNNWNTHLHLLTLKNTKHC
jgi:hypothetical protein